MARICYNATNFPLPTRINTKQRGIELLNEFSKEARMNQTSNMTLEEKEGYTITVPGLKCCVSEGDTLEEAIAIGTDAACGYIISEDEYLSESRNDRSF